MAILPPAAGSYFTYEVVRRVGQPQRHLMRAWSTPLLENLFSPVRHIGAVLETVGQARLTHHHPGFNITHVLCKTCMIEVTEEVVLQKTFGNLLHFRKDMKNPGPKVLIVAPMSGHFATLIRGTIQEMLRNHDVYVTDWKNARDIPIFAGTFDLDDYIEYLMTFIRAMGRDVNLVAICQPAVAAIAAVSLMAQANEEETPATLALLAGPVDPRVNPTQVNNFAVGHTIEQFRNSAVDYVPWPLFGMGRQVYPGFRQVGGFMSMNMSHHLSKHKEHFAAMVRHDEAEDTSAHRAFYDEYCSVMDLTAEFYLDTVARVFQLFQLPRGQFVCNGRLVEPRAITKTAVLAIEGGQDDITGIGQTKAVFELLTNLPKKKQGYHLEAEAGHYGVFSGRRFKANIEPQIRQFILTHN